MPRVAGAGEVNLKDAGNRGRLMPGSGLIPLEKPE